MALARPAECGAINPHFLPMLSPLILPGRPEGECCTTIESATAWLKAYVDEHQLEDLVLIGHSLGTAIALQYALTYPDRDQGNSAYRRRRADYGSTRTH